MRKSAATAYFVRRGQFRDIVVETEEKQFIGLCDGFAVVRGPDVARVAEVLITECEHYRAAAALGRRRRGKSTRK